MHVPDGFVAPQVYLPAWGLAGLGAVVAARRLRRDLDENTLPQLAILTACSFVVQSLPLPLLGGTSAHASGAAILALRFGGWTAALSLSMVLAAQALVLGVGGVTVLGLNAMIMAFSASAVAVGVHALLARRHRRAARFLAGWAAVVVPAALMAVVLGLQPHLGRDAAGRPLFFPFGFQVTLPAIVLPHALLGIVEGMLTVFVPGLLERRRSDLR